MTERRRNREGRERKETEIAPLTASLETRASAGHPDRNEDSALGDTARLQADIERPPTRDPEMQEMLRGLAQRELTHVDGLKERNVFGVLDGVSTGNGEIASRVASEMIASVMSNMRKDADAEFAKARIGSAMGQAHDAIKRLTEHRPDLGQISTTADVVVPVDNGDGTFDVAYGHAGDSRIYVLDGETGELRLMTLDDGYAKSKLRRSEGGDADDSDPSAISREEYDLVMNASGKKGADGIIEDFRHLGAEKAAELGTLFRFRSVITRGLGVTQEVTTGIFKAKKGDRILISSDGIHDNLRAADIARIMREGGVKELVDAAYGIASSGEGRAKPDDITASLIELGGEKEEKTEIAELPVEARMDALESSLNEARVNIMMLEKLKGLASRIEKEGAGGVTMGIEVSPQDLDTVERLGLKGIEDLQRDWRIHLLEKNKELIELRLGPEALARMNDAEQTFDWARQLNLAAQNELAKARKGDQARQYAVSDEAATAVRERMRAGEDHKSVALQARGWEAAAAGARDAFYAEFPDAAQLRESLGELKDLQSQKERRAQEKRAEAAAKRQAEAAEQQRKIDAVKGTIADLPAQKAAEPERRHARMMPTVRPEDLPREQPPAPEKKTKKKGFWDKLLGR